METALLGQQAPVGRLTCPPEETSRSIVYPAEEREREERRGRGEGRRRGRERGREGQFNTDCDREYTFVN